MLQMGWFKQKVQFSEVLVVQMPMNSIPLTDSGSSTSFPIAIVAGAAGGGSLVLALAGTAR
jgi:hypothetical protein